MPSHVRVPSRFNVTRPAAAVLAIAATATISVALTLGSLSRDPAVVRWVRARELRAYELDRASYEDLGVFETFEERLWHEIIPTLPADGPFIGIFGASNVKQCVVPGELPPDLEGRCHVMGAGNATARFLERLIDTLEHEKRILRRDSVIVLGLYWATLSDSEMLNRYSQDGAVRWGLWSWGPERVEPAGWFRDLRLERVRLSGFALALRDRLVRGDGGEGPPPRRAPTAAELATVASSVVAYMGEIRIPGPATAALERVVRRARLANATVILVDMPLPSWLRNVPPNAEWRAWLASAPLGVPIVSLQELLDDADFAIDDLTVHPRRSGARRLQDRIVAAIREHAKPPGR